MSHVLLIGFMGAGKSTVARLVAARLERPCIDVDEVIVRDAGRTVSDIFAEEGEIGFRNREVAALESLQGLVPSVVACGGGVVMRDENRRMLKLLGNVVYLRVSAGETLARVGEGSRPLLSVLGGLPAATALLAAREALYTAAADYSVDTVGRTADEVAEAVIDGLSNRGAA